MKARFRLVLLAAAIALAACSPSPETAAGSGRSAEGPIGPKNPFFGQWQLTHAQVAPWWDSKGEEPIADPALTTITFEPGKSSGPPIVSCDQPQYSVSLVTPPGLFEGNLADAFAQARMLGFLDKDITVMSLSCESGGADVSLHFPMLNDNTIMLGLDNVIYTFTRTPD